jgi:hypothetical protein
MNERKRAAFGKKSDRGYQRSLTVSDGVNRLLEEIQKITKPGKPWRVIRDDVIISTHIKVRNDGLPYSKQKTPEDSGVAVYFDLDGEPYCLSCDKWDRVSDNQAAIAAHIGAMRGMERWGVADLKTAFAGHAALPNQVKPTWYQVLGVKPDTPHEVIKKVYQKLRSAYHTDNGGDANRFNDVLNAWNEYQAEGR